MINEAYWLDCPSFMEYVVANVVQRLEKKYVTQQEMTQGMAVFASYMNFQTLVEVVKYANFTSRLQMAYVINFQSPVERALFYYHIIENVCKQTNTEHIVNVIQESFIKLINNHTKVPIHDIKKRYKYVQPWDGMPDPVKPISDEDIFKNETELQQVSPFIKKKYKTNRIINVFRLINEIFDIPEQQLQENKQANYLVQTLLDFLNNNAIKLMIEQLLNYDSEISIDRYMLLVPELFSNRITHLKLNSYGQQLDKALSVVKSIFPNLRTLDLQGLHYNYIDQYLGSSQLNLTYINLSCNNITVQHSEQLINFLNSQANLKELHINQNNLGPQLAKKLAKDYLAKQKSLVILNVSNCNLSCFTYKIFKHLSKSETIKSINVAQNYFGESINKNNTILDFIQFNQSIEFINLIDSSLQTQLCIDILQKIESKNSAYKHQLTFWDKQISGDKEIQSDSVIFGYKPQKFLKALLPLQENDEINKRIMNVQVEQHSHDPLFQRRYYEKQLIYSLDNSIGDIFYGISERWLRQWRSFVNGDTQKIPQAIDNTDIKHLHQKPVQSNDIFRKVNRSVWNALHEIYGGGPEVLFHGK